jgi:phage-related protein
LQDSLPNKREARVFFGFYEEVLVALHAIIKKTQKTPANELTVARDRLKEMQSWRKRTRT